MKRLPKTLYVRWDYPKNGDPWLLPGESVEDMLELPPDEKAYGVYQLIRQEVVKSAVSVSARKKSAGTKARRRAR